MPQVTESLGRVKHCARQMCCQERALADQRDSCPRDGVVAGEKGSQARGKEVCKGR